MISGKQLDEVLRMNDITPEYLVNNIFSPLEIDFEWEDVYGPDEDGYMSGGNVKCNEDLEFQGWIESFFDNVELKNLLDSLARWTDEEYEQLRELDVNFSESEMIIKVWEELYDIAAQVAYEDYKDAESYNRDPMGYYGVSWRDFV